MMNNPEIKIDYTKIYYLTPEHVGLADGGGL